jgi:hypothetical protein
VTINPAKPSYPKNQAYVHDYCSMGQAEFYDSDWDIDSRFDLYELLTQMKGGQVKSSDRKYKFDPLTAYFRQQKDAVFTLTFSDIEKILDCPLSNSAYTYKDYWYRRGDRNISLCWLSSGYRIRSISLDKSRLVFERQTDMGDAVDIPDVFLKGRIPPGARAEMEILFEYIRNKYGI